MVGAVCVGTMMGPRGPLAGAACCRRLPVPLGVAVFTSTRLPQTSCMVPWTNTASTESSCSKVINLGSTQGGVGLYVCVYVGSGWLYNKG